MHRRGVPALARFQFAAGDPVSALDTLRTWATVWGVGPHAMQDLYGRLTVDSSDGEPSKHRGEADVQAAVRREGADKGLLLFRNNVGALVDARGVPVRYGLANDSKAVNARIKSADLIGIRPVLITEEHLGRLIGQFVSREIKAPGWRYNPNDAHEAAQMRWATLIASKGGDACLTDRVGTL